VLRRPAPVMLVTAMAAAMPAAETAVVMMEPEPAASAR